MLVVLPPVGLLAAVEVVEGEGVVQVLLCALKRFSGIKNKELIKNIPTKF